MPVKRPSKAEIRRRTRDAAIEQPIPELPAKFAEKVASYTPREVDPQVWAQIRPFVVEMLCRYEPETEASTNQRLTALTAFCAWAQARGYALERTSLLTLERVEAFTSTAPLGKTAAANYRSRLRGIVRKVNPSGTGVSATVAMAHKPIQAPYSPAETAALVRIARTQPSANLGRQLCACVGLGLGAGLDSRDLRPLRRKDVVDHGDDGIRVKVSGPSPRSVWVRIDFESLVRAGLNGLGKDRLIIGVSEDRRNVAAKVFEQAHILGDAPPFSQSRMRITWLAGLLAEAIPLPVIMDAAGLSSARTLTELVAMREPSQDDAGQQLLRGDR